MFSMDWCQCYCSMPCSWWAGVIEPPLLVGDKDREKGREGKRMRLSLITVQVNGTGEYWVGQKVCLGFFRQTRMNFLANPNIIPDPGEMK